MALDIKNPKHTHRPVGYIFLGLILLSAAGFLAFNLTRNQPVEATEVSAYEYTINQSVNNTVMYSDNSFFENGPKSDNTAYLSDLTDKVQTKFSYQYESSSAEPVEYDYTVIATVRGVYGINGSEEETSNVWTRQFELLPRLTETTAASSFSIEPEVEIPFSEYRTLVEQLRTGLALPINTEAEVTLTVNVKGEYGGTEFADRRVSSVTIPLNTQIYQPVIKFDKTDTKQIVPVDAQQGRARWAQVEAVGAIVLAALGLAALVYGFRRQIFKTPYQRELDRIYRYHDGIIIKASRPADLFGKNIVPVQSFDDILNLEEELKAPIVATQMSIESTRFMIIRDDVAYIYTLGKSIIDEEAKDEIDDLPSPHPTRHRR